ncbi:hypothetical protein HY024_04440, partial [Candidatus Curtissbacteria bacterium]|nr:hypothetical protein [Candidatus Curtissbacteria bacterium]
MKKAIENYKYLLIKISMHKFCITFAVAACLLTGSFVSSQVSAQTIKDFESSRKPVVQVLGTQNFQSPSPSPSILPKATIQAKITPSPTPPPTQAPTPTPRSSITPQPLPVSPSQEMSPVPTLFPTPSPSPTPTPTPTEDSINVSIAVNYIGVSDKPTDLYKI